MSVVIIGGGQAAHQLAFSLKEGGYDSAVTVMCGEPLRPYQRPPLSKTFITAGIDVDRLALSDESSYARAGIRLVVGERVTTVDRGTKRIFTDAGTEVPYDFLVFATGAQNRTLAIDPQLEGLFTVRSAPDAVALRESLSTGANAIVVGGGLLGLEFACVADQMGCAVTVVEQGDRVMGRVLHPVLASMVAGIHEAAGIRIKTGTSIAAVQADGGRITGVRCADGELLDADLILASVGITPNDALAAEAGLGVGDGIIVDEWLRTSDEAVFAIGDCARVVSERNGSIRGETVLNATDQADYVARAVIGGRGEPFTSLPSFWSKQGSVMIHVVGHTDSAYETIDVNLGSAKRYMLFVHDGALVGGQFVNCFKQFREVKALLEQTTPVSIADLIANTSEPAALLAVTSDLCGAEV